MREHKKRWLLAMTLVCLGAWTLGCGQQQAAKSDAGSQAKETREFAIEGMKCEGCVGTVTAAIEAVPGVASVAVSLSDKKAVVTADYSQASPQAIVEAVGEAGYKARPMTADERPPAAGK